VFASRFLPPIVLDDAGDHRGETELKSPFSEAASQVTPFRIARGIVRVAGMTLAATLLAVGN
jgi:hypothetical protein